MSWDLQRKTGRETGSQSADAEHEGEVDSKQERERARRVSRALLTAESAKIQRREDGHRQIQRRQSGQARVDSAPKTPAPGTSDEVTRPDAEQVVIAAADIVQHERRKLIAGTPPRFHAALELLYAAVCGRKGYDLMPGEEQVQDLDAAIVLLEPALSVFRKDHEDAVWLAEQLMQHVTAKRSSARYLRAMDRVDNAMRIDGKLVEIPSDNEPQKQAAVLRQQIHKLAPKMLEINEQVLRANEHGIEKEAETLLEGKDKGHKLTAGSLVQLQATLWLVDGFLTLSDEEFQHELKHVQGVFNGVATYSELVKVATELLGTSLVTTASFAGVLAKLAGDSSSAALCAGVARSAGMAFGKVIAGVEIVHGIFVLADPHASAQKKMDAAAGVASGSAWFAGLQAGGAATGFAASTAIILGYAELKYAAHLYWQASLGLTNLFMRRTLETLQREGASIARAADRVAKVREIIETETDAQNASDLQRVHENLVKDLAHTIDYFLDDAAPHAFESGVAQYPGVWPIFLELFAPLKKYRHAKNESTAVEGAAEILKKITWALAHAGEIATASARQKHLNDLEHDLEKKQSHGDGEE